MINLCKDCGNHNIENRFSAYLPSGEECYKCYSSVKLIEYISKIDGEITYGRTGDSKFCKDVRGNKDKCPNFNHDKHPYLEHIKTEQKRERINNIIKLSVIFGSFFMFILSMIIMKGN